MPVALSAPPRFAEFREALAQTRPDAVSINTWPDTHAEYAIAAMETGAHVFVEKPLAPTVAEAERVAEAARRTGRKLAVGYILRHHPSWMRLVEIAQGLGKPLVMRMNLSQQSVGETWAWHRRLMEFASPIVDCGVHYVDIMGLMTGARAVQVQGIGVRLADDIPPGMYNYGQLQVVFEDGSVGWYEAGWGPMMSQTAFFVKDVIGPRGSVSITGVEAAGRSDDMETHISTRALLHHRAEVGAEGGFAHADEVIHMDDEPGHQALCDREQAHFLDAILHDRDLSGSVEASVESLRIVLAADESIRTGRPIRLRAREGVRG